MKTRGQQTCSHFTCTKLSMYETFTIMLFSSGGDRFSCLKCIKTKLCYFMKEDKLLIIKCYCNVRDARHKKANNKQQNHYASCILFQYHFHMLNQVLFEISLKALRCFIYSLLLTKSIRPENENRRCGLHYITKHINV